MKAHGDINAPLLMPLSNNDPAQVIARYNWWHTIELGPDLVTPGAWDIRHLSSHIPWPDSIEGQRCLDVGTRDGFWAFEMERRGAREVLAIDVAAAETDVPFHLRQGQSRLGPRHQPGETFNVLVELLGSRAKFQELNVYHLRPERVGKFDLIFMGYMLHQLRDPLRALEAVRDVCRGSVIVLDQIISFRPLWSPRPLARIGARRDFAEWFYFNAAGLRRVVELAGFQVTGVSRPISYRRGPGVKLSQVSAATILKYSLGRAARSLAVRGEVHPRRAS